MDKKASLGIGTLVIFIAILIAVAVVAYTIMQTHSTLSARSYESFTESKKSMVTKILPEKLVGESISPHSVQEFVLTVTSAPGSKPVEMNDSILVITSMGKQVSLTYGGDECKKNNSDGFNTIAAEELGEVRSADGRFFTGFWIINPTLRNLKIDIDGDRINDSIAACDIVPDNPCPEPYNGSYLQFSLSRDGPLYVPLLTTSGTLGHLVAGANGRFNVTDVPIGDYGLLSMYRTSANNGGQISFLDTAVNINLRGHVITLDEDIDRDRADDRLYINDTHVFLDLSNQSAPLVYPLGVTLTGGNLINLAQSINDGIDRGDLTISGTTTDAHVIESDLTFSIVPEDVDTGYFSAHHIGKGMWTKTHMFQEKEVIELCFETSVPVNESEMGQIQFMSRNGYPTQVEFLTPDVISTSFITLYP